jgi:UDP-glucose 4-epimerase
MSGNILVTGGAGYIGSHTCLDLLQNGWTPVVVDNFVNSKPASLKRVARLTNRDFPVIEADVRETGAITQVLKDHPCEAVIHFAGLKAVGESSEKPLDYYSNNFIGSHSLLVAMQAAGCKRIVFSSSATVYGEPKFLPYTEDHPLEAMNPYGQTKLTVEHMLRDADTADADLQVAILRYFNPVGAHPSGEIGEDPRGIPNNLMPFVAQVAVGRREKLSVYGDDYDTPDGTGVRDYIHVMDLARAHTKAVEALTQKPDSFTVNLGTGKGVSVLEMVEAFRKASGAEIPYEIAPRRAGDLPSYYADATRAKALLGWEAELDLDAMCRDNWKWQSQNPNGYED